MPQYIQYYSIKEYLQNNFDERGDSIGLVIPAIDCCNLHIIIIKNRVKEKNMKRKKIATLMLVGIFALTNAVGAIAATKDIVFKFVDSNSYTYLDDVTKASQTDYASVKITKFYKADGTPTTAYDQLYVQCGSTGGQAGEVLCLTGTTKNLTLKGTNNKKGTVLYFYGKGHNPALDCYVDANLDADVN